MKKTLLRIFALALTLCTVLSLASCFSPKPKRDLEKAEDNLEDEDYIVSYTDDEDKLPINVVEKLTAKDDDDNELTVTVYGDYKSARLAYKQLKLQKEYTIDSYERTIDYYEIQVKMLKNQLKKYDDDLKNAEIDALEDSIDEYEDMIKDTKKELKEYKDEWVIGRSGKKVWSGTEKAIKASKG